jgi:hypothetical protein
MKILCYTSCYGLVFKGKLQSPDIKQMDIVLWYERTPIDFSCAMNYDVLICEYINSKNSLYTSDDFIKRMKDHNPDIIVCVYPLIVMNIFPFHRDHFGYLTAASIHRMRLSGKSDNEILSAYDSGAIRFDPVAAYRRSMHFLKAIEAKCDVCISDFIETHFIENKEFLFHDSLFPINSVFNELCSQIAIHLRKATEIKTLVVDSNERNDVTFHINNARITPEMIAEFKLTDTVSPSIDHSAFYRAHLVAYLNTSKLSDL